MKIHYLKELQRGIKLTAKSYKIKGSKITFYVDENGKEEIATLEEQEITTNIFKNKIMLIK